MKTADVDLRDPHRDGRDNMSSDHETGWCRVYILGNSGPGKSWLAAELAPLLNSTVHHLDTMRWRQEVPGEQRDNFQVAAEVVELSQAPSWIMEGVYGWLAQVALPRATTLIWVDLPVDECVDNVRARGPQGGEDPEGYAKTIAWAEDYRLGQNSSCFTAHEKLFSAFGRERIRLQSRADIAEFLRSITPKTA